MSNDNDQCVDPLQRGVTPRVHERAKTARKIISEILQLLESKGLSVRDSEYLLERTKDLLHRSKVCTFDVGEVSDLFFRTF
jgi:hypothetical protein